MDALLFWSLLFLVHDPGISLPVLSEGDNPSCDSNPCQNGGTCFVVNERLSCICSEPFTGRHCEEGKENSCASYDCKNGGTCYISDEENPKCYCQSGYSGSHCEETEETSTPLVVTDPLVTSSYSESHKTEGFSTVKQPLEIQTTPGNSTNNGADDPCASFICYNGASCTLLGKDPVCVCPNSDSGPHCGRKTNETSTVTEPVEIGPTTENSSTNATEDPCAPYVCLNGGACFIVGESPNCVCQTEYSGPHCEKITEDPCASDECLNGGSCYIVRESPRCICQTRYSGRHCEERIEETSTATQPVKIETTSETSRDTATDDPCGSYECLNGGACFIVGENPRCLCQPGYNGPHCEEIPSTTPGGITSEITITGVPTLTPYDFTNETIITEVPETTPDDTTRETTMTPVPTPGDTTRGTTMTPETTPGDTTRETTMTPVPTRKPDDFTTESIITGVTSATPFDITGETTITAVPTRTTDDFTSESTNIGGNFSDERDPQKIAIYSGGGAGLFLVLVIGIGGVALIYTKRKRQRRLNYSRSNDSSSIASAESADSTTHLA